SSYTWVRKASSLVSPAWASATARPAASFRARASSNTQSLRSTRTTARTPRLARSRTTASPMPLAAPVTTATLSAICTAPPPLKGSGESLGSGVSSTQCPVRRLRQSVLCTGYSVLSPAPDSPPVRSGGVLRRQFEPLVHPDLDLAELGLVGLAQALE